MPFVNWHAVNAVYCGLIWMIALILALVIIMHGLPQGAAPVHHGISSVVR